MKAIDFRELTEEELAQSQEEASRELFNLKLQQSLGQLENPARIRHVRRNLARIQTICTQRQHAQKGTV